MMQDLRPEIEAINEEMRNVSTFIFFSSPCSLYGIFVGFTGYAIMLYYFTMPFSQLIQDQWKWGNRNWASYSLGMQLYIYI